MDKLLSPDEVANIYKVSKNTIYSNPKRYGMFKIGGLLRTTKKDIEFCIAESKKKHNNVIRLTLGNGKKELNKCQYSRETVSTILTSEHPAVNELRDLLK